MDMPPHDVCYRALATRDARFDGRLFVAVKTTGIYCRPICPARPPKAENCRFFPSAAAAQSAGFRPCLRCRPEISPDAAAWRGTSNTVSRALSLIAEGGFDGEEGVGPLAARLGVGERQLRRLFDKHLGAPPIAVAQTRRILFAKQLIQDSELPMSAIAEASGFGSVRRFNDAFRKLYGRTPRELRVRRTAADNSAVTVKLGYRQPYDWDAMLSFLAGRTVEGVEFVEGDCYSRTVEIGTAHGSVMVAPARAHLVATVRFPDVRAMIGIVARLRRLFDLDADVETIGAHLSADAALAPLIARRPGLRAPGGWDGFELAVRAILGQQVSVAAARKLAGKLVALTSPKLSSDATGDERLKAAFPTAARVANVNLSAFGMPGARIAALQALAHAVVHKPDMLLPNGTYEEAVTRLLALPGFGPWTAQYWALRALHDSDAFPASDVGLLRAVSRNGKRPTPKALLARAEAWRPWRAYAAQHLWTHDEESAVG
ncbi:MAG: DNA-3-methyladenine glycosylase 2 family protein [Alphaproteobacteria bacterium]|nr:helix-turn-helix domain-containing protein [Alphaproteobacteria bacterium]MDE2111366.1 DNA-3-methyladenine glycosylase 2 family protein [Alphaproteobacteria bacterium]MDE2495581.1 DNA-3-methyladenine glycosylase 2 family protein [Alphaproteobacteria bacterium]